MYVGAHRVSGPRGEGVNAYLYEHRAEWPRLVEDGVPKLALAERAPGRLVAAHADVTPGGNAVLSYLDALVPDGTPSKAVQRTVERLLPGWTEAEIEEPDAAVRFKVLGAFKGDARREGPLLLQRIVDLLAEPREHAPLVINKRVDEAGVAYWLADETVDRVRGILGERFQPARVCVPHEAALAWQARSLTRLLDALLPVLTGFSATEVLRMGGVRIINVSDAREHLFWPVQ